MTLRLIVQSHDDFSSSKMICSRVPGTVPSLSQSVIIRVLALSGNYLTVSLVNLVIEYMT